MQSFTHTWNILMSIGVFVCMALSLNLLYALVVGTDRYSRKILAFTNKYILWIGLVLSGAAMISSLVYSNIIGYEPCMLCWYTRIFFYPEVVLYIMALVKKDRSILPYTFVLTLLGLAISTYHYITESFQYSPFPCSAGGVSCLTRYVYEFGFITIPFMGLVGFLTLGLALLAAKRASKISTL